MSNARYASYVKDISGSGHHLLSIINDILDLAKAEANKLSMDEREVDLVPIVAESFRMCEPKAQQSGITLAVKSCADHVIVRADAKLVLQILLNLVSNAVKFSHEGGAVEVELLLGSDRTVTIAVRDQGIGIPASDIERVLRPFEQVENSRTRAHGGTGLGLPYAVKLAELHGGTLWIESQINVGTSVMVVLPRERFVALRQATASENLRRGITPVVWPQQSGVRACAGKAAARGRFSPFPSSIPWRPDLPTRPAFPRRRDIAGSSRR